MRRNVASGMSDVLHGQRHRDTEYHQDRADAALVFGSHLLEGRAGPEQAFGDPRLHARAGPEQAHGESRLPDRAHMASELGDHFGGARACSVTAFGDQCHGARADQAAKHVLGDQCHGARADDAAMHELGEVYQQDRAGIQHQLGGAPHHSRALRQDREVVEDGDLKGIPIQLPTLTSPDGRDASLEAGDWLIQLEPLIGDLSKNAASWWRRVMDATTSTYARWLHADPLSRLKIAAAENGALSSGFERLDQRVTSLLLQSVPKAIKDEVIATRELSTTAILFRVMRTFQPGGLLEKSRLLEDLTTIPVVKSNQDVVAALRLWKRKASRASELCAQLPDPLLLVRTLDGIAKPVVENSSQANFQIATFRMNCSLDIRPSLDNVWLFFDLLLAEAEVAIHSTTTASPTEAKTPTKAAVKALQGSATTRTTTTGANVWPCKFWMSEAGCRQGQRCRWPHPWEGVSDRASRCANCSSTQHLQADCPAKAQVKPPVGGEGGENREETGAGVKNEKGGNKGKGKGKGKAKNDSNQKLFNKDSPQGNSKKEENINRMTTAGAEEDNKGKNDQAATSTGGGTGNDKKSETGGGTDELLREATKLLKSLHLPNVKMITLQEIGDPLRSPTDLMLLDSGATHALRRASSWSEWQDATETVVALAKGTTSSLRLKWGTETLLSTPEDTSFGNGILPMGALTKLGYDIAWSGGECKMVGIKGDKVAVTVVNGCPMVPCRLGMELMERLENESRVTKARSALVRAIVQHPDMIKNLPDLDATTLLQIMLKKEFPDLPDAICQKVAPAVIEVDAEQLPWNRGLRRRMLKARRVILHLYSGKDQKTWQELQDSDTVVVCLDRVINPKMDMLNDHVFLFLMQLAARGSVHAIIGGPPCRTVSARRYAEDDGPKPVRSEQEPYGLSSLSPQQRSWVEDDVVLMFRMKLLYMTATQNKPSWCDQVLFAMEQPQDPKEYRSEEDVKKHQYMSVWRTAAWRAFQEKYQMMLTPFEQGAYGHVKPKPTSFGHNIKGFELLQGAKTPPTCEHRVAWKDRPLPDRIAESSTWSEWAPGVKAALVEGLRRNLKPLATGRCHHGALGSAEEAPRDSIGDDSRSTGCQFQLCPLSKIAISKWKAHILNDHQPMRRDCKVCVEAAGRSRPHKRIQHPSAYCLSVDLSGKLKRGKDQFGQHCAYVLVGSYTFPTTLDDVPLCGPGQSSPPADAPLPSLDEVLDDDGVDGDVEDGELPRLEVELEEEPQEIDEQATERAKKSYDSWMKLVEHCKQVKVKTLTFTEVITSRSTPHLLEGLAKIYSKVRSLGLPVLRLHADRARELTSKSVQAWCHSRDITTTYTSGSDWKSNGRAENEIGIVKRHAKVLMRAHDVPEEQWPILVRHAAERRLRWQLQQVGYPVPDLLPFYTRVLVKRKSWNQRYAAWRWERSPGRVMGPDPWSSLTSGGYCIQLEDGKFLASTDVVVENNENEETLTLDLVVQEKLRAANEPSDVEVPKRRLRGKQGVPQVARLELDSNSGEDRHRQYGGEAEDQDEEKRLLHMHGAISTLLAEECTLVDDMDTDHAACVPVLSMLAHQKLDLELHLRSIDLEKKNEEESENFLVKKP